MPDCKNCKNEPLTSSFTDVKVCSVCYNEWRRMRNNVHDLLKEIHGPIGGGNAQLFRTEIRRFELMWQNNSVLFESELQKLKDQIK